MSLFFVVVFVCGWFSVCVCVVGGGGGAFLSS